MLAPDYKSFEKTFNKAKAQILYSWISADLVTPVSAYLNLCGHKPYSFLLESVEGGTTLGRYSIIGMQPDVIWTCRDKKAETEDTGNSKAVIKHDDALASLKSLIHESTITDISQDLPPMCGFGLFGYIGYDMIGLVEDIPANNPDTLGIPDSTMIRPSILAVFDNVKQMICIATPVYEHKGNTDKSAQKVFESHQAKIEDAIVRINQPLNQDLTNYKSELRAPLEITSETKKEDYLKSVARAVEYINAGDIFQVVPSQRFSVDFDLPSIELYRSLRSVNPSPFLFHLSFEGFALVGSSPEILVRVRDNTVTIRPIAGTRKRGSTKDEDKALEQDLLSDEKELAEHLMLIDLGRNDVGRVAEIGSVKVTDQFTVERYSHVMHIVSNVEGTLREDLNIIDALFSGFPAGTVSGAPKIRAMEIIDELEPSKRCAYAGGVGYFSDNTMDSCIALRTALVKDGKVYVQAGGGVVADSIPENEHQECVNKAKAVLHAAELAIERFK
ncbi:MAG: anthranilate synthase component I [Alphaproteobacteria bacterium]|nr:anthranilate synthase component I [Alphaproteobacteria bacterium]